MSPHYAAILLLLSILLPSGSSVLAQERMVISGDPQCDECRFRVDEVVLLKALEDPAGGVVGSPRALNADSRGRFAITAFQQGSEIRVFSPRGTFLQTVGGSGQGPGEFSQISFIGNGIGDSIWVFDLAGRVSILSPEFEYARSFHFPGQVHSGVPLSDGRWIINADLPTPDKVGLPLHVMVPSGRITHSFGSEKPTYRPSAPYLMMRSVSPTDDSCVWSVSRTEYVIEKWCSDGALHSGLVREVDWFEPYTLRRPIGRYSAMQPWIVAVQEDSDGLLWVLTVVPSSEWSERFDDEANSLEPRLFDTIIEVLDPHSGSLLLSEKIPETASGFIGNRRIAAYDEDDQGKPSISVLSVVLDRERTGGKE